MSAAPVGGRHATAGREPGPAGSRPAFWHDQGQDTEKVTSDWPSAVDRLYVEYRDLLLRYARSLTQDRQAAEDLVQESFEVLLRRPPGMVLPGRELAYLRAVVRNASISALRHRLPLPLPDFESHPGRGALRPGLGGALPSAEEEVVAHSEIADVADMLRELPQRQREVFGLTMQGFSPSEIACMLGIEPNTVRGSLHHARVKVQAVVNSRRDTDDSPAGPARRVSGPVPSAWPGEALAS